MVLVANKTDCTSDRVVSTQEGEELSKMLKVCPMRPHQSIHCETANRLIFIIEYLYKIVYTKIDLSFIRSSLYLI